MNLCARGGFEVDIAWENGQLTSVTIRSIAGTRCTFRYGEKTVVLQLKSGQSITIDRELKPRL